VRLAALSLTIIAMTGVFAHEPACSQAGRSGHNGKRASRRTTKNGLSTQVRPYVWKVVNSTRYANRDITFEDRMEDGARKHSITINGGTAHSIKDSLVTPGSSRLHVVVNAEAGSTECAGLKFTESCTLGVLADGTVVVDRTGLVVTDNKGRSWTSRKTRKDGRSIAAFVPS
jgi:hypothetical protein